MTQSARTSRHSLMLQISVSNQILAIEKRHFLNSRWGSELEHFQFFVWHQIWERADSWGWPGITPICCVFCFQPDHLLNFRWNEFNAYFFLLNWHYFEGQSPISGLRTEYDSQLGAWWKNVQNSACHVALPFSRIASYPKPVTNSVASVVDLAMRNSHCRSELGAICCRLPAVPWWWRRGKWGRDSLGQTKNKWSRRISTWWHRATLYPPGLFVVMQ